MWCGVRLTQGGAPFHPRLTKAVFQAPACPSDPPIRAPSTQRLASYLNLQYIRW